MPLIKCKVCDNTISATAEFCPHCGEKNLIFSKVIIHRKAAFGGSANNITVIVDGISITMLRNDESFTTELPTGNHIITVSPSSSFGGPDKSMNIMILASKTYNIEVGFNSRGIFIEGKIVEI